MAAIEKTNVGLGTALAAAFDFNAAKPLDSRLTVPAYDGLAALSDAGAAYPGMRVYVETGDKQGNYQYIDSEWVSETAEIKALIDSVATAAMEFKGAISNGTLPTEGAKGDMYKITTTNVKISAELNAEEAKEVVAKPGDTIVRNGDGKWFYIPSGDDMDDTWRPIKAGGNTLSDTETLEFLSGDHVTITEEAGKVTIAAEDTHYESKIVVGDSSADVADANAEAGQVHLNLIENGEVKSSHKIVGGGGISVTHTVAEGEDSVNVITIEAAEGAKYDLAAKIETTGDNKDKAYLSLTGTDNSEDKVYVVGDDAVKVTVENGKVKISAPDTTYNGSNGHDIKVEIDAQKNINATIQKDAVTTDKIADAAVTADKLADDAKALFKSKQTAKELNGGSTIKTVTKVTQNENGEVDVTYENIAFPEPPKGTGAVTTATKNADGSVTLNGGVKLNDHTLEDDTSKEDVTLHKVATTGSIYDVAEGSVANNGTDKTEHPKYIVFNCGSSTKVI